MLLVDVGRMLLLRDVEWLGLWGDILLCNELLCFLVILIIFSIWVKSWTQWWQQNITARMTSLTPGYFYCLYYIPYPHSRVPLCDQLLPSDGIWSLPDVQHMKSVVTLITVHLDSSISLLGLSCQLHPRVEVGFKSSCKGNDDMVGGNCRQCQGGTLKSATSLAMESMPCVQSVLMSCCVGIVTMMTHWLEQC